MTNDYETLYQDIARRTGGNIYIGVTGPVRAGKSTFVKRVMESLVLPRIEDVYRRERAKDEIPQCGSGRTIMTAEPKFVPEEAVEITPDGTAKLSVRLIDCVGYLVPGAVGATEDGRMRMVTTPWFDHPIPMPEAAELGTKKVMAEHSTVGIVVTTDGSVTDLDAQDYLEAERRAITDMQATGKPFLVLLNTEDPTAEAAQTRAAQREAEYGVRCLPVNCLTLDAAQICEILKALLFEFDVSELRFYLPGWFEALENGHPLKTALYEAMRKTAAEISKVAEAGAKLRQIVDETAVQDCTLLSVDLGSGTVDCRLEFPAEMFYELLSEKSGVPVADDRDLMRMLSEFAGLRAKYDRIADALEQVRATGYGVVSPSMDETVLEAPELIRKGGAYGVRLRASAPSIHLLRADLQTEISPMVGDESQTRTLVGTMREEYETDTEALWNSNIFGRSVYELISDGLNTKLTRMQDDTSGKLRDVLTKVVNDGANGMICLIL